MCILEEEILGDHRGKLPAMSGLNKVEVSFSHNNTGRCGSSDMMDTEAPSVLLLLVLMMVP